MKKIAIVALLFAFAAAPAVAENMYAGASVGATSTSGTGVTKTSDTAFRVLGGYTINPNFSVEAEYINLGKIQVQSQSLFDIKSSGVGISALGTLPLQNNFSLYGKLGFTNMNSELSPTAINQNTGQAISSNKKSGVTFGLGGEYNFAPNACVRFGMDSYQIDAVLVTGNITAYTVSGVLKF